MNMSREHQVQSCFRIFSLSTHTLVLFLLIFIILGATSPVNGHPALAFHHQESGVVEDTTLICRNEYASPFDYSVKPAVPKDAPMCVAPQNSVQDQTHTLFSRQVTNDDFSCSQTKPCSNGACCSKTTGYCNYGPEACGTNGQSPNDVCWSNCNAKADCGRYADPPGKECPLKVCCGPWGFCGMTSEFCTKDDDITKGCQSNCDQPGSGKSGGNVQSKVIGYYEAWVHDRTCTGMSFSDIPVGALTHLYFSFGYINPGDFSIAPMDNLPFELFTDFTDLKRRNPGLKCVVALGGWTFNDPGPTQKVFSDMVSTSANRAKAIQNLLSFMRQYAFDGVDFDWEYPGADDRGGTDNDGINFTQFLKELREAISKEPQEYVVSFTIPTSYWYLRHFDLKSIDHVDFVNVMSYDLHGTWDSQNPIGNNVLAHTNLTEIKLALDLLWRNGVDAGKLNLGIGFYGRSFQLSDPACYRPGCKFKGGAAPGGCSGNSGTLSYREIMQVIDQYKLQPFYDKENEVKYIVWNQDQWVSYDDEDTIKAKIKFANDIGLGGLLIWSVDQDTADLSALKALLAPKSLSVFAKDKKDASYWQDVTATSCYVTDCGATSCQPGFMKVTNQPCGGAKPVTRHSKEKDSLLCCPISSAPNPATCRWRGTAPSCNGHCHEGEVALQLNRWGDGKYCEDGNKVYCCDVPAAKDIGCYWTDGNCKSGDELRTFKGTFLGTIADILSLGPLFGQALASIIDDADIELSSRYCCTPAGMKRWKNCNWYGQPGSCFDNHCEIGSQVQLTDSKYGAGVSCFPRMERTRVFCCEAADGEPLFPPVPLKNLFPNPPPENDPVNFDVKIDNTWGDGIADTQVSGDPNEASFAFWVLTSPEAIQISLDKRDGSHWELFNCDKASQDHDEPKTVQMICMDMSKESNCDKIYLGHGVPGTIVELPPGCGPSKYAVAKSLEVAKNQTLPSHLSKRDFGGEKPVVYDFTFDFEWRRVPRDLGDTQMRVDFSNEVGYWDNIVEKAAANSKRRVKRSLGDTRGSHRRWLEEEWRDDVHRSALSKEDLHKRWFGSDIIDWLRGLLGTNIKPEYTHNIDESFTAILVKEEWPSCTLSNGITVNGHMDVRASAKVKVATSFGLTIIAKLDFPSILDLSNSYLYFKNRGEVTAIFTLDAEGKAVYKTGDKELVGLQNFPGATFSIPKLLTVGPNFKLYASAEADVTLKGHLESRVDIASWDVQQTYPNPSSEYDPKSLSTVTRDMTLKGLQQPTFDYSLTAEGQLTAHLKPTFVFGIDFDKSWNVEGAKISLVADGWMRMYAKAELSSDPAVCPFKYGIDVGADLYAKVEVPSIFSTWNGATYQIASLPAKKLVDGNTCPQQASTRVKRGPPVCELEDRSDWPRPHLSGTSGNSGNDLMMIGPSGSRHRQMFRHKLHRRGQLQEYNTSSPALHSLTRRGITVGPLMRFPPSFFPCPNPSVADPSKCASITGWDDGEDDDPSAISKRAPGLETGVKIRKSRRDQELGQHLNFFTKRASRKTIEFCVGIQKMRTDSPEFDSSGDIVTALSNIKTYAALVPDNCNDFTFGIVPNRAKGSGSNSVATEHVLEFQLLPIFFDEMQQKYGVAFDNPVPQPTDPTQRWNPKVDLCHYMQPYWYGTLSSWVTMPGFPAMRATDAAALAFPSRTQFTAEWVILEKGANRAKERMWGDGDAVDARKWPTKVSDNPDSAIKNVKDFIMAYKYHKISTIQTTLKTQANRVGTQLEAVEDLLVAKSFPGFNGYKKIQLKGEWDTWIRGRWLLAKNKADNHMQNGLDDLKKAHGGDPDKENDANKKILKTKIQKLEEAVNSERGTWGNPF